MLYPKEQIKYFEAGFEKMNTFFKDHETNQDLQNTLTPFSLCEEILQKIEINKNKKILVLCNLEFVLILKKLLDDDLSNVYFITTSKMKHDTAMQFKCHENKVYGTYDEFFEDNDLAKFDVVIGNPPYQGPKNGSNSYWKKFIKTGFQNIKINGIICLITPQGWLNDTKSSSYFKQFECEYVNLKCKHHFGNIGSTFSWWIIKNKENYSNITEFDCSDGIHNINISDYDKLPNIINSLTLSIQQKLLNCEFFESICMGNYRDVSAVKNDKYKFSAYNTKANPLVYLPKDYYTKDKKVIFTGVSDFIPFYDDGTIGVARQAIIIKVNDKITGMRLEHFMNSPLIHFFNKINRNGGFSGLNETIPKIDLSKDYSNSDYYTLFNLSKEEIQYIENFK